MGINKNTKKTKNPIVKINKKNNNNLKEKNNKFQKIRDERNKKEEIYNNIKNIDKEGYVNLEKNIELTNEDEALFNNLKNLTNNPNFYNNLNDNINKEKEQIREKEIREDITKNPKVRSVYTRAGEILQTYRAGKLPKSLHVIPNIENFENLIELMKPEEWSPHGTYEMIKIFINTKESTAISTFFSKFILKKIRNSFKKDKKLHGSYYNGMIKAFYRPKSWLKGFFFPLVENNEITNKEAQLYSSILQKSTIPSIFAGVAILKLLQSEFNAKNIIFLKTLLGKKIALPKKILDSINSWILKILGVDSNLPILFFQTILCFIKYYDKFITKEERIKIRKLVKSKCSSNDLYIEINNTLNKINEKEYKTYFQQNNMIQE